MTTTINEKQYNKLKSFWLASDGFVTISNCPEDLLIKLATVFGLQITEVATRRYQLAELDCDITESFQAKIVRVK